MQDTHRDPAAFADETTGGCESCGRSLNRREIDAARNRPDRPELLCFPCLKSVKSASELRPNQGRSDHAAS